MKVLQVHNYYQQKGGEDAVVSAEKEVLEKNGHEVIPYYKNNKVIGAGLRALGKASLQTVWNPGTYTEFRRLIKNVKPDVVHCHNIFPLISPAVYWACSKEKVPVVQTLHNYRLLCLNALLFRGANSHSAVETGVNDGPHGSICELCLKKKLKWPGLKYNCYRQSKSASIVVACMLFTHRLAGTWSKKVTAYIALTPFQKQKMVQGGLPENKIYIKPNFIRKPDQKAYSKKQNSSIDSGDVSVDLNHPYALFVGRLSPEKGCDILVSGWNLFAESRRKRYSEFRKEFSDSGLEHSTGQSDMVPPSLLIVGEGPERVRLETLADHHPPSLVPSRICFLGPQNKESVLSLMKNAQFIVLPSVWYEGFPMTIVEAFSCGTPVVASDQGGMSEIIQDGKNGLKFRSGDPQALAEVLSAAFSDPSGLSKMGQTASMNYCTLYSEESNYQLLINIYEQAISANNGM